MTRATIFGGKFTPPLFLLALAACNQASQTNADAAATSTTSPAATAHQDFIYGRVTTTDGDVYEGELRFGGDEEALWGNYFNGFKDGNPWLADAPSDQLPRERMALRILGVKIAAKSHFNAGRPFMARFGDISRIEARGRSLTVTLKSGTVFHLDRYAADDYADGVRVQDASGGVVDLQERRIRSIELLSNPRQGDAAHPLYGTVLTSNGVFTGLIQWDREACLDSDELHGLSSRDEVSLRFADIRAIARAHDGVSVTLLDGGEVALQDSREDRIGDRGMYVDDPRYGRVLVSWDAFERVDFSRGESGSAYEDFQPGRPLTGTVVTRSGRRLTGRLVYDLDESETTETLDAPAQGVDYTLPFALIGSIEPLGKGGELGASVRLASGEELRLERAGDLGEFSAGMLIYLDAQHRPEYVPWTDVARVDFDRATPTSSPSGSN